MVATCSGCDVYMTWGAAAVGVLGGLSFMACHFGMLLYFKLDDPLDATAVHGAAGIFFFLLHVCGQLCFYI